MEGGCVPSHSQRNHCLLLIKPLYLWSLERLKKTQDEEQHTRDLSRLYLQKSLYAYDVTIPSTPISCVKPCRLAGLFVLDVCNYYTLLIPIQPDSFLFSLMTALRRKFHYRDPSGNRAFIQLNSSSGRRRET